MADQENIDRAKKGKNVWNAWAENELKKPWGQQVTVDFSGAPLRGIDFSGFVFPGYANFKGATLVGDACFQGATESRANFQGATFKGRANFEGATFEKLADFEGAIFKGEANLRGATFRGDVTFKDATFEGRAYFLKARFISKANFEGATFKDWANFRGATFKYWADFKGAMFKSRKDAKSDGRATFNNATFEDSTIFTGAYFEKAPSFHNAAVHQNTAFSFGEDFFRQFPDIKSDGAERAYRTLKLAMNKYQSHTEEAGFFKLELRARAYKEKKWHQKWLYRAYGLFSDYGQGILRPLIWWAGLGVAIFVLYVSILGNPGEVTTVTIAQALPLIGVEKEALKEAMETLFPPDGNAPLWFQFTRALHMVVSYALIFLTLLALRNRFKIK